MTNKKTAKRAFLMSLAALILCFAMLLGTTYAWFTDSVTSGNNKVVAGSLKIDLELLEKDGTWTSIKSSNKAIFDYDNWEPGYTDVKILKVENEGTLALKWVAKFVSESALTDLAKVIDVYVCPSATEIDYPDNLDTYTRVGTVAEFVNTIETTTNGTLEAGEVAYLGIALKMQESAGNEYQGMSLGSAFDIMILATQLESEEDAFGKDYDKDAKYTAEIDQLRAKLAAAQSGDTVEYSLSHDAYVDNWIIVPAGVTLKLNGNGHTIVANTTAGVFYAKNSNLHIEDATITGKAPYAIYTNGISWEGGNTQASLTNVTVDMKEVPSTTSYPINFGGKGNITLTDCTVTGAGRSYEGNYRNGTHIFAGAEIEMTINGGNIGGVLMNANYGNNSTLTLNNNAVVEKLILANEQTMSAELVNNGCTVKELIRQVDNAAALQTTIDNANAGDIIMLEKDIADTAVTVDKSLTITGNKTLNNVSITASGTDVELTVSELNFTGNSWINANNAKKLTVSGVTANVAPVNGTATNSRSAFIALGSSEHNKLELVVENCNIVLPAGTSGVLGWAQITKATITGNTFGSEDSYIRRSDAGQIGDAVKVMSIANGAEFTVTGNTVYTESNGFAFGQNTTRDNAYTVVADNNTFYGSGDHIWVEVSGAATTHATIQATSNNTVNGKTFTAADIKSSSRLTTWTSYAGVDVVTDGNGNLTGGTFTAKSNMSLVADGYVASQNADGTYTVVAQ